MNKRNVLDAREIQEWLYFGGQPVLLKGRAIYEIKIKEGEKDVHVADEEELKREIKKYEDCTVYASYMNRPEPSDRNFFEITPDQIEWLHMQYAAYSMPEARAKDWYYEINNMDPIDRTNRLMYIRGLILKRLTVKEM